MDLIVVIVGLLVLRKRGAIHDLHRDQWFLSLSTGFAKQQWLAKYPLLLMFVAIALPVALVQLVLDWFGYSWLGLPYFIISLVVFLYALGRGELHGELQEKAMITEAQSTDTQPAEAETSTDTIVDNGTGEQVSQQTACSEAYSYFEKYFAVVFWFMIFGAAGALLYRLSQLFAEHRAAISATEPEAPVVAATDSVVDKLDSSSDPSVVTIGESDVSANTSAHRWLWLVEWLPVRVQGLSMAFMANFSEVFSFWCGHLVSSLKSHQLLGGYLSAAMPKASNVAEMQPLFRRTLIFMFAVIAVLTILL